MQLTRDDARFIADTLRNEADHIETKRDGWGATTTDPLVTRARELADRLYPVAKYLPEFRCYVWLSGGTSGALMTCEPQEYELPTQELDESAVDVSAPESQEFLDAVNKALGTSFVMSQFAWR